MSVDSIIRENEECPSSGVTSYGRVWGKDAGNRRLRLASRPDSRPPLRAVWIKQSQLRTTRLYQGSIAELRVGIVTSWFFPRFSYGTCTFLLLYIYALLVLGECCKAQWVYVHHRIALYKSYLLLLLLLLSSSETNVHVRTPIIRYKNPFSSQTSSTKRFKRTFIYYYTDTHLDLGLEC